MSPGKIDCESVRRHLFAFDEAMTQLQRHSGRPVEAMRESLDERWTVERGLHLCVQNVLDIATHLAASAVRDFPDYTTAIEQLGQLGVIPSGLAAAVRPLAGFRNALVHGDLGVYLVLMHSMLNQHLNQVREFAEHIERHIDPVV